VQAYIDGTPLLGTPRQYSLFLDDSGDTEGFGFYSSTPGTMDATLDFVTLTTGETIPEPSSLALVAACCAALACVRRRRKV
jgi:hypothetical protein